MNGVTAQRVGTGGTEAAVDSKRVTSRNTTATPRSLLLINGTQTDKASLAYNK